MERLVMLIDDNPSDIRFGTAVLESLKYKVVPCQNVEEAKEALNSFKFDLIFLDLNMPGVSGIDFLYRLHIGEGLGDTPIVVLSGRSEPANVCSAIEFGAKSFFVKPLNPDIHANKIAAIVDESKEEL